MILAADKTWHTNASAQALCRITHEIPHESAARTSSAQTARVAELHRQATANDLSAQDKAIRADITKRQETVFWISIAGAFIVALGSILALLAMM
jgi:hypothetical protein